VAPDQCCHSYCAPCLSNCDGKVCGDDGAGGSCGECVDDIFCIDGECRYITEKLTCAEYLVCTEVCWPWDDTCFKDCETLATPKALAQNGLLTGCVFTECATCLELPEPAAEECLDHCLVFECPGALGLCVGTGEEADCPALVSCLEDCQGDSECMVECFELDGHSSAGVFEAWLDCARSECDLDGLPDMDDACVSEAAEGPCDEEYLVCFVL